MKPAIAPSLALIATMSMTHAATVVFSEDFEDDTIGNLPVISGSNVGGSYTNALNAISVGANPETVGNTSAQALIGGGGTPDVNNIQAMFASPQLIGGMTISFDFYNDRGPTGNANDPDSVRVALQGTGGRDVFMRNDRDQLIKLDGTDQTETNYGEDVWQNFSATFVAVNAAAGDYTLNWTLTNLETLASISGNQSIAVNTANFANGGLSASGLLLEGYDNGNDATNFFGVIDNVVVTVPEPSIALLGGLGLLGLLRRRR